MYSIENGAQALQIVPSAIKAIKIHNGNCSITFQPSFRKHEYMREIQRMLLNHNVESYYLDGESMGWAATLEIRKDYLDDFIRYVNSTGPRNKM